MRRAGCRARCSGSSTPTRTRAGARSELKDDGDPTRAAVHQALRGLRSGLRARRRGRFRRAAAARLRVVARQPGAARALSAPLPPRAGRRVPGHQRHPVRLDEAARRAARAIRSRSATTTSRSTAGAARAWRTCTQFRRDFPDAPSCSGWSRTTAPPAHSRGGQRADLATTPAGSARTCGRAARRAIRSGSTPRSTSATRRSSSPTASATGSHTAARGARSRSCTARTRSRACSKRRSSRRAFPTRCTAACGSSSARKSRMRWRICA